MGEDGAGERLELEVSDAEVGQRVDRLVTQRLRDLDGRHVTRSTVQRWIAEERVLMDGVRVQNKTTTRVGSVLTVLPAPPPLSDALPDASVIFDVVFEDEHLLVVNKPAGLVVHPARGHRTGTLVNGLLARPGFLATNADPRDPQGHLRPGIVHRLDKDTSGLLVVAKGEQCREGLKSLFATHTIDRSYVAIAVGTVSNARFDTTHGRHPKSRKRFTSMLPAGRPGVRNARTDVALIRQVGGCSLVRCTLHTGRTHQIRVHMLEQANAPILGDTMYKAEIRDPKVAQAASTLGRQALHAAVLGFVHPMTGEALRWECEWPDDMSVALASLE